MKKKTIVTVHHHDNGVLKERAHWKKYNGYIGKLLEGEYETFFYTGQRHIHAFHKDHRHEGEFRVYDISGVLQEHRFWKDGKDITEEVKKMFDVTRLTDKDKFTIKLKWGIKCLK